MHGLVYMHDSTDLHGSPGITIQIYGSDGMCSSHGMYDPTSMHDLICFAQHALPCFTTEAPSSSVQLLGEALLDDGAAFLEPLRRACQGRKTEDGLHKAFLDYHLTLPLKQRDILLEGNFPTLFYRLQTILGTCSSLGLSPLSSWVAFDRVIHWYRACYETSGKLLG